MGVRSYTYRMTSLPCSTLGHSPDPSFDKLRTGSVFGEVGTAMSGVVVDWSSVSDAQAFMDWIGNCPRPSGIRVYLPSVAHRASMQRLQRSLQSMGCTVTCRVLSPVVR